MTDLTPVGLTPTDLTPLGLYYAEVRMSDQLAAEEWEAATEVAIEAIAQAGFDAQDSDRLGAEMSADVQALLTLAFVRCPELMEKVDMGIAFSRGYKSGGYLL